MQRTRWGLVAVLMLVGLVWLAQGTGVLGGSSFMVGDPLWAIAGIVLIVAGAWLAVRSVTPPGE